jgi:hypothetical protein
MIRQFVQIVHESKPGCVPHTSSGDDLICPSLLCVQKEEIGILSQFCRELNIIQVGILNWVWYIINIKWNAAKEKNSHVKDYKYRLYSIV